VCVYTNSVLTNEVIYSKSNLFSNAGISNKVICSKKVLIKNDKKKTNKNYKNNN
jgi:hypothetical protein